MTGKSRRKWALVALCSAFFVVQLDVTVVNVGLQTVRRELGGGLGGQQWVVASYTLALAAGMLTAGVLGDRFGARRLCVIGLVVFAIGSTLCAVAPTMSMLIAARLVQGIGSAALLPCSLALIVLQFDDPRERAHALGMWGGISSIGLAAGPVLGGLLIAVTTWRAIFLVNVPVCAVAIVLIRMFVIESPRRRDRRMDYGGLVFGTAALASVTGGLIEAGQLGWGRPVPLTLILGGLVIGVVFVLLERRQADPMLPMRIFASRPFSAATTAGGIFNFNLYGTLLCVSLFLQGPLGKSAFAAGLLILPLTIAVGIGATLSGRLTARFGPRPPMLIGYGFGAIGSALLAFAGPHGPLPLVVAGSTIVGFCSISMPAMTSVVMAAADRSLTGLASGVLNTARQGGGALGAAVLGTLLTVADGGAAMLLRVPMLVVVVAYLIAIGCTMLSTRAVTSAGSGIGPGEARTPAADQHHDLKSEHYERLSIHRP
jgi:DHA2 family methylenomycin A resistance protein-like MFS transporter